MTVSDAHTISKTILATRSRLCNIIAAHNLEDHIYVRLIHKHFDMRDHEVPVFRPLPIPSICTAVFMGPMPSDTPDITGKHYIFDRATSSFIPYEYTTIGGFNVVAQTKFLEEYKNELLRSNASHVFGFGIKDNDVSMQGTGYTEFELPEIRCTVMVPQSMMPLEADNVYIPTNWIATLGCEPEPKDGCAITREGMHYVTCIPTHNGRHASSAAREQGGQACDDKEFADPSAFALALADPESPLAKVISCAIMLDINSMY